MKKVDILRKLEPSQFLAFGGFIILFIASYFNIFKQDEWIGLTIIPYPKYVIPILDIASTLFTICIVIFPKKHFSLYPVLFVQAILTSLTGYEQLGIFLFSVLIVLIYLNGSFYCKKQNLLIILLYVFYSVVLLGVIRYGKQRFYIAIGYTYFIAAAFNYLFMVYRQKLTSLLPLIHQELYLSKDIQLPKSGEIMHLSKYKITERQKIILYEAVAKNKTYGEIALKNNLSLSLVKKEMTNIMQYFGCKNIDSLKIVLSQFILAID
ncbi:MAG: helix-turn-helix transcriptional regulator [Treponema sp.]|nr:helix-turn-helix transcriptional regulator [Treponema sp.]